MHIGHSMFRARVNWYCEYDLLPFYPSAPIQAGLTFSRFSIFVKETWLAMVHMDAFGACCRLEVTRRSPDLAGQTGQLDNSA